MFVSQIASCSVFEVFVFASTQNLSRSRRVKINLKICRYFSILQENRLILITNNTEKYTVS